MPTTQPSSISDLVRQLRQHLNLSQERFAARLGVSFKTVNRWENGQSAPSPMALKLIQNQLQQIGAPGKVLLNQYFPPTELGND